MYANENYTKFCNIQNDEFINPVSEEEMELKLQENIERNRVDNRYINNEITVDEVKDYLRGVLYDVYLKIFKMTDDYIVAKQKRTILNLWRESDEMEFNQKMQEYEAIVLNYKSLKDLIDGATDDDILDVYGEVMDDVEEKRGLFKL